MVDHVTSPTRTSRATTGAASPRRHLPAHYAPRVLAALLSVAVAVIHLVDQGGVPGSKTPSYVQTLYYVLEAVGVLVAVALLLPPLRFVRAAWVLAVGVAAGPLVGYALSRGPGLPDYTDDKGNWTEPIGVASLVVEGVLLVLAGVAAARLLPARRIVR